MYEEIRNAARDAAAELMERAGLPAGSLVVVGCSSSEIVGEVIGHGSAPDAAKAALEGIASVIEDRGLYLAAQCCEHLNRALVIEREAAVLFGYEQVWARPVPKAGGSFAAAAYEYMNDPVVVECVQASAGLDIGDTMIGMHLRPVAVPLRLSAGMIGKARVTAARTRPKLIGGERTEYPAESAE